MKSWAIYFLIGQKEYHFITFKATTFSHKELDKELDIELENCTSDVSGLEVGETDSTGLFIRNELLWTKITKFWASQDINSGEAQTLHFDPNTRIFTKRFKVYIIKEAKNGL